MKNVLCFGDSNTYGYDPRSYFGGRYDADSRWVDILAAKTGWYARWHRGALCAGCALVRRGAA